MTDPVSSVVLVWHVLLVATAGAHVGLELVVQLVVYPSLAGASVASPATARAGHEAHMRRMGVAVAPVYAGLVVAVLGVVVTSPTPGSFAALALVAAVLLVTALRAVPLHERIVRTDDVAGRALLHARLARADLARLVLAVVLLGVAVLMLLQVLHG